MAGVLARSQTHLETSHSHKNNLCHSSLHGPVAPGKYRTRAEPVFPTTTIPKLHYHRGGLRSRSLVESTKSAIATLSKTTKHGHAENCGSLQNDPNRRP